MDALLISQHNYPRGANISPWLSEDIFVQVFLSARETAFQNMLVLLGQLFLHVPFGASQDKRLDHLQLGESIFNMQGLEVGPN